MIAPQRPVSARVRLACAALLCVTAASSARGTTVLRQSVESLSARSDLVVRGHVVALSGHAEAPGHPFRLARVRVLEEVAGAAPAVLWVRLPGGADAAGRAWKVEGAPDLAAGDEVLLFLERVPEAAATRATVPAGAVHGPGDGARGRAEPAREAAPREQFVPVSLAVGAYHVDRRGGVAMARRDPNAAGMKQVAEDAREAAPESAALDELVARVRARRAGASP